MSLRSIELAGFKSFVDPTKILLRGRLNAIVGPNGCGKSNVVDAIRWVIGESSAKQLRGQSMSDVIFNGTSQRKPVGRAKVVLLFDNSDGRFVGEYAKYNEIAIAREVTLEGQSTYFINGTVCRRRDILDIFLGTGLGPRSYSIIEQGMVSQLIEAKPEELRVHFEEAAGISKYKERRRETENRIRHTRENLDRLTDLREELTKQLRHLKRQANAAERYKVFKEEERTVKAEIKVLQWQAHAQALNVLDTDMQQARQQLEKIRTEAQHIETALEKSRLAQTDLTDQQAEVQKTYYSQGAEIARIEQQLQHLQEQTQLWQEQIIEAQKLSEEYSSSCAEQDKQIAELTAELDRLTPQQDSIKSQASTSQEALSDAEAAMRVWHEQSTAQIDVMSNIEKELSVACNNLHHYDEQITRLQARQNHLNGEIAAAEWSALSNELEPLKAEVASAEQNVSKTQSDLERVTQDIAKQRQLIQTDNQSGRELRRKLQNLEADLAKHQAIQQSLLSNHDDNVQHWLESRGLSSAPRLGKQLHVQSGWELATEVVLRQVFDALCLENFDDNLSSLGEIGSGQLTLLSQQAVNASSMRNIAPTLISKMNCPWSLDSLLAGIYVADTLEDALQLRSQLQAHESVVTPSALWLGPNWVRIHHPNEEDGSILEREQMIRELGEKIEVVRKKLTMLEERCQQSEAQLSDLEQQREQLHQYYQSATQQRANHQATLSAKQAELKQRQHRQAQLQQELSGIEQTLETTQASKQTMSTQITSLKEQQQASTSVIEDIQTQRGAIEATLSQARETAQHDRKEADQLDIRLQANQSQLKLLQQTVERNRQQLQQQSERREQLQSQLTQSDAPLAQFKTELQDKLARRLTVETELQQVQTQLNNLHHELDSLEKQRQTTTEAYQTTQTKFQELQMQEQAIKVRQTTIVEQLEGDDFSLASVQETMSEDAEITAWTERAEQLERKISRLGPINLAAIDEHQTLTERKEYLDAQDEDLTEALTVLENAIRKIDRETKTRFKETFDKVNAKFQEVFPKIFGGGKATLECDSDDILATGVLVKAQPPGKRNATIQLLSGGEKALTAISLIFALFHLNPAPICVVDEVDAPLDDVNVGRFCKIVKEMSQQTQFIMISHNKVSIESADQLMGVTMQEPGVSRIVSVDVGEALEMVA